MGKSTDITWCARSAVSIACHLLHNVPAAYVICVLGKVTNAMSLLSTSNKEKIGTTRNDLPEGALLDYKDIVDKQRKELAEKISVSLANTEAYLKRSRSLQAKMRDLINAQNSAFADIGVRLGEENPFVAKFMNTFEGIHDFASKARQSEIALCKVYGIKEPDGGWDIAATKSTTLSKKRNSSNELSDILLKNSKKMASTSTPGTMTSSTSRGHVKYSADVNSSNSANSARKKPSNHEKTAEFDSTTSKPHSHGGQPGQDIQSLKNCQELKNTSRPTDTNRGISDRVNQRQKRFIRRVRV